jgi:malate/lactate dehydrogenase
LIVGVVGGGGHVGSACVARLAEQPAVHTVLVQDARSGAAKATVLDVGPVALARGVEVRDCTLEDFGCAGFIAFAAAVPHRDGAPRSDFLAENAEIVGSTLRALGPTWAGLLVMISNPVEALTYFAGQLLPAATVAGHALNDTYRFRQYLALDAGLASSDTGDAIWLGAHGGHGVPVWPVDSSAAITASIRDTIETRMMRWYDEWQDLKTGRTTAWCTATGLAEIVAAYTGFRSATLPLSFDCAAYGLRGSVLTMPVRVDRTGLRVLTLNLDQAQREALSSAAAAVQHDLNMLARLNVAAS